MTWRPSAKWRSDAARGFLGRRPPPRPGQAAQPLHEGVRVDIERALVESQPALKVWGAYVATDAPLYSGGVLDAWPAWVVDVLKVAKPEMESIKAFLTWEATQRGGDGHG